MNFSAVILAGGKSSRMGCDKAWLEVGGQPLLARQIEMVRDLGAMEIFISGRGDADYTGFGCRVLRDKIAGAGPLAGIERALNAATSPLLLALAVDLPEMRTEFLQRLALRCSGGRGVIPRLASKIEPLAAFYPQASHSLAEAVLGSGRPAVATFAEQCVRLKFAEFVELSACETNFFTNWNYHSDFSFPPSAAK